MKTRKIQLSITEYDSIGEMLPADRELMQHAVDTTDRAYAPYSHYLVGAAVRLSNGKIFTAGNQENAAYPSGLCAERIAMFSAKSAHPDAAITDLAVAARSSDFTINEAVTPCGACRQVMAEYQSQQKEKMRIIMRGEKGPVLVATLDDLLPLMFHAEELKRKP